MKGAYCILIENPKDKWIGIGSLGKMLFRKGFYCYVGSAMAGIEQRVERHLSDEKSTHWHIDYLLLETDVLGVFTKQSDEEEECMLASEMMKISDSVVAGFGCSDCKCGSHLFYFRKNPRSLLEGVWGDQSF